MRIEEYIPVGRENAISRKQLASATGLDDREVRHLIEQARERVAIVNLQDGRGYFIPGPGDGHDVDHWYASQKSRATRILKSLKGAEKYKQEHPSDQIKWEV